VNERLSHALRDLAEAEPALGTSVDDLVARGRRARRTRRTAAVALAAAAVALLAVVLPSIGRSNLLGNGPAVSPTLSAPVPVPTSSTASSPALSRSPTSPADSTTTASAATTSTATSPSAATSSGGTASDANGLLSDPGIEAPQLGWNGFGHGPVLGRTVRSRSGSHALQITSTDAGPVTAGATANPVRVITVAGTRYSASCWVRSDTRIEAGLQLQEYTTSWVRAGTPAKAPQIWLTDPATWYQVRVTYTAAADGHLLPLTVYSPELGASSGAALIVDDCSLTG
jgi:hypothetical protein